MPNSSPQPPPPPFDPRRIEVIDRRTAECMARLTGAERIRLACELGDSLRRSLRHHLTQIHPDWTPEQIQKEFTRRVIGGSTI